MEIVETLGRRRLDGAPHGAVRAVECRIVKNLAVPEEPASFIQRQGCRPRVTPQDPAALAGHVIDHGRQYARSQTLASSRGVGSHLPQLPARPTVRFPRTGFDQDEASTHYRPGTSDGPEMNHVGEAITGQRIVRA
jgi:hypothetical protein